MALMNPVLRRKQPQLGMARDVMTPPNPTGAPAGAMAFGGSAPRTPGNVMPPVRNAPPAARAITPGAGMGMDPRPKGPPPALPPRPAPVPRDPRDIGPAPGKGMDPGAGQPPGTDDVDTMIREFLAGQLRGAGKANTAEEEALIRQQMADAAGGMSVNARARAGASGMASSGALMAQEGDIRRSTSQDALDQILGLRRTEEQRSIDNAMGAIGAETGMRSAAANDELRRMALAALQAEMGLDAGEGGIDSGNAITDALGVETDAPATANAGGKQAPSIKNGMDAQNAIPVASPPPGATQTATPGLWYDSATRKYYVVN